MSETTLKGAIAESAIAAAAVEIGIFVLRPVIEGRRYDLHRDDRGSHRFQTQSRIEHAQADRFRDRLSRASDGDRFGKHLGDPFDE